VEGPLARPSTLACLLGYGRNERSVQQAIRVNQTLWRSITGALKARRDYPSRRASASRIGSASSVTRTTHVCAPGRGFILTFSSTSPPSASGESLVIAPR